MDQQWRGVFWENAAKLLDAAVAASGFANASPNLTVLINWQGGIHLITGDTPGADWPLDRLAADRGARTAYRVEREGDRIAVEGREGAASCRLETDAPEARFKSLLRDAPRYRLAEESPESPP